MRARDLIFVLMATPAVAGFAAAMHELTAKADMLAQLEGAAHEPDSLQLAEDIGTPTFVGLPFTEAKDFFAKKKIMSPGEFRALDDRYKARGFAIAGVTNRLVLEDAHSAISAAISDGVGERETMKRIKAAFVSRGVASPGDFHLQTVFDQNCLQAYAAGRYAQLTHADVIKTRPYWQYRTVGDNRVRPAHRAMNGKIFPANSPVWQKWFPPNGYRCRCGVESLSHAQVEGGKLEVSEKLPDRVQLPDGTFTWMRPDPGFAGSPATAEAADAAKAQIVEVAKHTGALQDTPDGLNRLKRGEREARDEHRRQAVDRFSGLTPAEVEHELQSLPAFNVYPRADEAPADGEVHVDWHMYSQNLTTAEQMVTRVVQEDGLYGLKDRISVVPKSSYLKGWIKGEWPDPEVAYDDATAAALGLASPATVARSTEYALRLRARPEEVPSILKLLGECGRKGAGAVRKAWKTMDVRVTAGAGVDLPDDGTGWMTAWRNVQRLSSGGELVTLSRAPLKGWDARPVVINRSLWEYLG